MNGLTSGGFSGRLANVADIERTVESFAPTERRLRYDAGGK